MPHNHEWQSRIKKVEREYVAMRQAADRFRETALSDPTILRNNLRHGEIVVASQNLEGTYLVHSSQSLRPGRDSIGTLVGTRTPEPLTS